MEISDALKAKFKSDSIHKNLIIKFPNLGITVENERIWEESLNIKESILEKENIEFVGCIASSCSVTMNSVREELKGQFMTVSITVDGFEDVPITLFNGYVDSAVKQSNRSFKKVTAYDALYTKANVDVSSWYNSLSFPITLKNFRDSLFRYIGITQEEIELPNDSISISRKYDPKTLNALSVIKAVCQINGVFGIINRSNVFEYRILQNLDALSGAYPADITYPSLTLYPVSADWNTQGEATTETFSYYKKVTYEEWYVKPVDKLTIRQSEDETGVTYGSGTNNYIIQGNMFTYGLDTATLQTIAENIYANVNGIYYYPYSGDNNGAPWVECGVDAVNYVVLSEENFYSDAKSATYSDTDEDIYENRNFYVFSRELSGIQSLRDQYSANGEEYQSEFITDLQTQIDTLKKNTGSVTKDYVRDYVSDYTYNKDTIDNMLSGGGGFNVESVESLPSTTDDNTIYLIQGVVVVE